MTLEQRVEALEKEIIAQKGATQKQAAHKMIIKNDKVKIADKNGATRLLLGPL